MSRPLGTNANSDPELYKLSPEVDPFGVLPPMTEDAQIPGWKLPGKGINHSHKVDGTPPTSESPDRPSPEFFDARGMVRVPSPDRTVRLARGSNLEIHPPVRRPRAETALGKLSVWTLDKRIKRHGWREGKAAMRAAVHHDLVAGALKLSTKGNNTIPGTNRKMPYARAASWRERRDDRKIAAKRDKIGRRAAGNWYLQHALRHSIKHENGPVYGAGGKVLNPDSPHHAPKDRMSEPLTFFRSKAPLKQELRRRQAEGELSRPEKNYLKKVGRKVRRNLKKAGKYERELHSPTSYDVQHRKGTELRARLQRAVERDQERAARRNTRRPSANPASTRTAVQRPRNH